MTGPSFHSTGTGVVARRTLALGALLLAAVCGLLPASAQAQIVFRGSSSAVGPAGGAIAFRAATNAVAGNITFRAATNAVGGTITFRAAATGVSAAGVLTLTVARPAFAVDDVMVAAIGVAANSPVITAPVGWTLVRQTNNAGPTANSLAVYYRVATATEPPNYTWTLSASTGGAVGGIQSFINVDTANPIDVENGQTTPVGAAHLTPSVTTTVANAMVVTAHTYASSQNWAVQPCVPPPVGCAAQIERFDRRSGGASPAGQSVTGGQVLQAVAGATGQKSAQAAGGGGSADAGNTHILALRPALRIAVPAGTSPNDVMIAAIGVQPNTAAIAPPAGWTLVNRIDNAGPTANSLAIYRKVAGAAESAGYVFAIAGATFVVGGIQTFTGVDTTTPIDVQSGQATPVGAVHLTPSVTTTVANAMVVTAHAYASSQNWTPQACVPPPAGCLAQAESFDQRSGGASPAGQSVTGGRVLQAATGATGRKSALAAGAPGSNDAGNTHILALRPSATSIMINRPGAVLQNDVMIASIGIQPNTVAITPPAGWTLVRRVDNAGATANSLAIYRKIATASEPGGYYWTFSAPATAIGGIQAFVGVDIANPIDVENGQATGPGNNHAVPIVATTVVNTMMVAHYTIASAVTWAPQNPPGPPPAMTESFDVASRPPNNPAGQSLEGTRLLQAAAGATPAWTSTASGGGATSDRGNTHILALRPGVGNAITITTPPGTQVNDVMVAAIGFRPNTLAIATPAGWTFVRRMNNPNGDANSLAVYIKVAGAAEPATHTWVFDAVTTGVAGGIQSFSGVDTATPINVENGQCTPPFFGCAFPLLFHWTPSVTTTVANTMIVTAHTFGSSATWTPPAGMTESYDRASLATPNANGQSIEGNRVGQGPIGATGIKIATASANADVGNTHILALHPAPPAPPIPGGFNAYEPSTPPGAITGVIKTKISGSPLTVDVIALNAARTAILTTFFGTVTVELLNAADNTGPLDPLTGCRSSWTPIPGASGNLVFALADNGRKAFSISENNSWRDVRVRVTSAGPPVVVGCSNDNFAIRPSALTVSAADATWTTPGSGRALDNIGTSGGTVHKAGYALRVTAAAQPASATQYDGIPTIVSATCLTLAGMTGCNTGTFTLPGGAAWSGAGARINDSATYDEVGALSLLLEDQGFASVDAADSTLAERTIPQAGGAVNVGRFVPDNFVVAPNNVPSFQTFGSACASRSFTYVGQPFGYVTPPQALVTARNATGGTTTNYRESLWKITTVFPSDVSQVYGNGGVGPGIDTTLATNAPAVVSLDNGTGTVTVSNLDRIFYTRSPTTPDAPFNASVSLTISVRDDSEADGQITTSTATAFGAIPFDFGNPFRYGRLRLQNANGSQLISMLIPISAQYWNGSGFVTNTLDNCTTIAAANVALGNYQKNLNAGETIVTVGGAFNAGVGTLRLSAPGAANNGSVDVSVNLTGGAAGASCTPGMPASTGSGLTHLQGAWCGAAYVNDPTARATFGVYRGADQFIYQRENF